TVVVLTPESGDTIQTMKAGLLEVADIFVINKADREGADKIFHELRAMLEMSPRSAWEVPVLKTQAFQNIGVKELGETLEKHRKYLQGSTQVAEKIRTLREGELEEVLQEEFLRCVKAELAQNAVAEKFRQKVLEGEISAYEGAKQILPLFLKLKP
ncbi:MAG TPA: hypothetical protein DF383_11910, partial [Deltaproteobacteria bacterium]|nr:hypothetical protein [Deltaproteobacteria bacterium]